MEKQEIIEIVNAINAANKKETVIEKILKANVHEDVKIHMVNKLFDTVVDYFMKPKIEARVERAKRRIF